MTSSDDLGRSEVNELDDPSVGREQDVCKAGRREGGKRRDGESARVFD